MTDKVLTVRMSPEEHQALKLHAVLQGRSINGLVLELIRAELATSPSAGGGQSREDFVAELFRRAGVDPASPEHQAAAARAKASIRHTSTDPAAEAADRTGERGVA